MAWCSDRKLERKIQDAMDFSEGEVGRGRKRTKLDDVEVGKWSQRAKTIWYEYLSDLQTGFPNFFTSDDAKLLFSSRTWRGRLGYEGVGVSLRNCLALQNLYIIYFRAIRKHERAEDDEGFQRLCSTVSQFLRLGTARAMCSKEDLYKRKVLFLCVSRFELVQHFVKFLTECRSFHTLARKAKHLRQVCEVGFEFMRSEDERSCLRRVLQYLNTLLSARRPTSGLQPCPPLKHVSLSTIRRCIHSASSTLHEVMESYRNAAEWDSQVSVARWTSAFVALLVLSSGGQSPQALAQIQFLRLRDFVDLLRRAAKVGFISLPTLKGTRTMLVGIPEVTLPVSWAIFLQFHVSVILPAVELITHQGPRRKSGRRLLVNQASGAPMGSRNIAYEFKKFMTNLDPSGNLLDYLNEAQLIDVIARYYNTYDGQVRRNLGHRGSADHVATANELTRVLFRVSE